MKHYLILVTLLCLVIVVCIAASTGGETVVPKGTATPVASTKADRVYPIAPGVWYPGDGALPEKPMRYYRVRCWPGCHRGSAYGKYPNKPLNMTPIFPTRAALTHPATQKDTK